MPQTPAVPPCIVAFGERSHLLRKALYYHREEWCRALEISSGTLSTIEASKEHGVKITLVYEVARLGNVSTDWLLGRTQVVTTPTADTLMTYLHHRRPMDAIQGTFVWKAPGEQDSAQRLPYLGAWFCQWYDALLPHQRHDWDTLPRCMQELAWRSAWLRERMHVSWTAYGQHLGCHQNTLIRLSTGAAPSLWASTVVAMADWAGVSVEWLLGRTEAMPEALGTRQHDGRQMAVR